MSTRVRVIALMGLFGCISNPIWSRQISFERILGANKEPENWLTYSGTTFSQRHSLLSQITAANVKNLELQWIYQARSLEKFEATPLVVDGVLYTVQPPNDVIALDAATGRIFWTYSYHPEHGRPCCGRVNRGLAILGDTLFMGTLDSQLIAIDAKDGHPIWQTTVAKARSAYVITHAPLIIKDKVLVGVAGAEFAIRGFIGAYDSRTGRQAWRFNTVPGPGELGHETWGADSWQTGGAPVWVTGSYDPALNLTYWGTGNPSPDWNSDARPGDNLYSDSVIALDADTGKLKWYYQFTPHDDFDFDSVQVPVLADIEWQGKPLKAMVWAHRNGFFYVLDRTTGQFLLGKPFFKFPLARGLCETGKPCREGVHHPTLLGLLVFPANPGGTSWSSPSSNPRTGSFHIPARGNCSSLF